ncbi:hypothetical protein phiLo_79 [Thermus phage phiLo]|nr:hypothetical protein phiLo_79 [Thermus phage phiLo]
MLASSSLKIVQTLENGSFLTRLELPDPEPGEVRRVFMVRRYLADASLGLWDQEEELYLESLDGNTLELVLPPRKDDQEWMVKVLSEVSGEQGVVRREAVYLSPKPETEPEDSESGGQG